MSPKENVCATSTHPRYDWKNPGPSSPLSFGRAGTVANRLGVGVPTHSFGAMLADVIMRAIGAGVACGRDIFVACGTRFGLWVSRTGHYLIREQEAAAIRLREVIVSLRVIVAIAFYIFIFSAVALRLGLTAEHLIEDGLPQGMAYVCLCGGYKS
ncbi:hypothetical protein SAMD00023353_0501310 [Rosellinia necatrix]|uniref:Uncharacterized protein n=1 Tax=Rosellinia necatrix TaxID=77044 RepID=A0A1S8A5J1_ROSNE|nr:hypothetical protein SAMD00023353_0501310 [Rosellinia necatrix]